ncbi:MAG TPA: PAS domain S-box protein [Gemmatimonadales bacterium]|nr:PAS domain S-box protein [Gemmatimonadales bacterium]
MTGTPASLPVRTARRSLSIRYRLPLLIGGLLVPTLVVYATLAYLEVRRSALLTARERLSAVTRLLAELLQTGPRTRLGETRVVAQDPAVAAHLRAQTPATARAAEAVLRSFRRQAEGMVTAELWAADGRHLLSAEPGLPRIALDPSGDLVGWDPARDSTRIGPVRLVDTTLLYPAIVAVRDRGATLGYIAQGRRIGGTAQAARQLGDLLGPEATLLLGGGSLWTDLAAVVPGPPMSPLPRETLLRYERAGAGSRLGWASAVPGTPWVAVVEFPRDLVLGPARRLASRLAAVALVLLVVGSLGAVALSRGLTGPISELAEAAGGIAGGDYARRLRSGRSDELGQLARAFDAMAERVEEARRGLERQVAERTAALRASEEQFRSLAATALEAIITADARGRITYFNGGAEHAFGYSAAEVMGQPLTVLMPERFREAHLRGVARYLATREARVVGRTVELAGRRKDGTEFPMELSLASWVRNGEAAFAAIIRDVTARKQAEEALERSTAELQDALRRLKDDDSRLEQIFESLPVAIYVVDHEGRPRYANRLSQEILGRGIAPDAKAEDLASVHRAYRVGTDQVYPGDEQPIVLALQGRPAHAADFEIRLPGEVRRIEVWAAPVFNGEGRLTHAVAAFTDITARERARAEIERLNRELAARIAELEAVNRELDTFCYSVSHDLRAPLRSVDGFSRILVEDYGPALDLEARRLLGVVRSSTKSMGQLIDDLLAFSRLSRKAIEAGVVDMRGLARAAAEDARVTAPKAARVEIGDLPEAYGDAALLRQVWVNLIGNALKFSSTRADPRVEIGAANGMGETVFFVRDNGVGFDMSYADKLFGVFQRLHRPDEFEGTGVGLAIVQRVVHRHGGRVWAEGKPGEGATFYFTLPTAGNAA